MQMDMRLTELTIKSYQTNQIINQQILKKSKGFFFYEARLMLHRFITTLVFIFCSKKGGLTLLFLTFPLKEVIRVSLNVTNVLRVAFFL